MSSSDSQVQRTNDDAVLSKRSANKAEYFDDEYLKFFAGKLVRRAPLINRGYYLRAAAMRYVLQWFVETRPGKIQIISLGCGFDTSAYRLQASVASRTTYFEIDYAEVLTRKKQLLSTQNAPPWNPLQQLHYIGCDLRQTEEVIKAITTHGYDRSLPTLFLAECVLQYIPAANSFGLISSLRSLVGDGDACLAIFDQMMPNDAFGEVMKKSLKSRSSPLLGIEEFGNVPQQEKRFDDSKWDCKKVISFVDVYDALLRTQHEESKRVNALEAFDEYEDWVETCRHYCMSLASTRPHLPFPSVVTHPEPSMPPTSSRTISHTLLPRSFKFKGYGHATVAFHEEGDVKMVTFGGHVNEMRSSDVFLYDLRSEVETRVSTNGDVPTPRVHHGMAMLTPTEALVFGGRGSPDVAYDDTYILDCSHFHWKKIAGPSPAARFRHCQVSLGTGKVLVFGGAAPKQKAYNDAWVFDGNQWSPLPNTGLVPHPRHTAAMTYVPSRNIVLLHGGLSEDAHVFGDLWSLDVTSNKWTQLQLSATIPPLFSHTMTYVQQLNQVVIAGGVSESVGAPCSNVLFLEVETMNVTSSATSLPTLCKHTATAIPETGSVVLIGGGFQCFSFGTHLAQAGCLNLSATSVLGSEKEIPIHHVAVFPASTPQSAWDVQIYPARRPALFKSMDMGTCVNTWKEMSYLIAHEGKTQVSVHVASDEKSPEAKQLDFIRKNFSYVNMPFGDLVEGCFGPNPRVMYFRSLARQRGFADVWSNFPGIARDFVVPPLFHSTATAPTKYSQSCLRMNGRGVQLWTHYDIMDNILCQIVGTKRVVLYPPSQYGNLYMEGSTSKVVEIDKPDYTRFPKFREAQRHAIEVMLEPGDVLFIPSMWFHNVTALDPAISVNVFWRHLEEGAYDPKDTYGNRDLPAMVQAREKIVAAAKDIVKSVPADYRAFVLHQVLDDLEKELH